MKKISFILATIALCSVLLASCGVGGSAYVPGTVSENGYSSEWLGIQFVPSSNMIMASDDELKEMMELGSAMASQSGEDQNIDWDKVTKAYEMMATDILNGNNVIVMTEKLASRSTTVKQYITGLKTQFDAQSDIDMTYGEVSKISLAGEKYTRFPYEMSVYGMTVEQIMLLRKVDDRMVCICITGMDDSAQEEFLSCFKDK